MAAPDQTAKDLATQQRIINHMNKDHHDSITRYLEHHHALPPWTASKSLMTSLDLNGMTFRTSHGSGESYHIPFNPPLDSYTSARARVVQMDQESLAALHRSPITITTFPHPTGIYALALLICTTTFLSFSQRWWFAAHGPVASVLGGGFAGFAWGVQPWVFWGMVLIHSAELAWFVPARLRRHSVDVGGRVFWLWCAAEFVCGVFCTGAFDALVEEKRVEKEKAKH